MIRALLRILDLSELVPAAHARFEPLLRDGLEYFLNALNRARRQTIIDAQLALPATAGTPERIACLLQCCPTVHKLGQLLARDNRLMHELPRRLVSLNPGLGFGVPVTVSDLFSFWGAMPLTLQRAWLHQSRQLPGGVAG